MTYTPSTHQLLVVGYRCRERERSGSDSPLRNFTTQPGGAPGYFTHLEVGAPPGGVSPGSEGSLTSSPRPPAGPRLAGGWSRRNTSSLCQPSQAPYPRCGRAGYPSASLSHGAKLTARWGRSGAPRVNPAGGVNRRDNAGQPLKIAPLSPPLGRAPHETRPVRAPGGGLWQGAIGETPCRSLWCGYCRLDRPNPGRSSSTSSTMTATA